MAPPLIKFAPNARQAVVGPRTRELVIRLLEQAACPSCLITSTSRTPFEQARAMYNNIRALGVSSQLALYADAGDQVIEEYVRTRRLGLAPASIIAAMTATINAVGPSKVSLHCSNPNEVNVIDIAPSSIDDPRAFLQAIEAAEASGAISRFFSPGRHDPAFHLEIPQG